MSFQSIPDATTSIKGKVKLAQDLKGTADLPQVITLLAYKRYGGDLTNASYTISATSMTDVDATNLAVTFTAPQSGKVFVELNGMMNGFNSCTIYWGLRESTTTLTNSTQWVFSTGATFSSSPSSRVTYMQEVTGLTAGNSYTYKWAAYQSGANGFLQYGTTSGWLTMKVTAITTP